MYTCGNEKISLGNAYANSIMLFFFRVYDHAATFADPLHAVSHCT